MSYPEQCYVQRLALPKNKQWAMPNVDAPYNETIHPIRFFCQFRRESTALNDFFVKLKVLA